jgi:beta-lactamase regulating signal transducer with metallopeptidase domain
MTGWLFETFIAVSLLIVAVLLLRGLVARLFGAEWAYSLWLIPALRLVLPPLPQLSEALPPVVIFIPATGGGTASLPADAGPGQWVPLLLATWAGGAVIFLTLQWLAYRAFLRRLDTSSRPARPPEYGGIATFVSEAVDGPLALGLLRRRIVIPSDFSRRYSDGQRRLAMEHELTHHRRRDIWWNMAAILFLALNWFNPLAWIAFRAFRTDQELACDAAVAGGASAEERHQYALAMVKSAARPGLIAACSMNGAGELKRRLRMMRSHRSSRLRSAGGLSALGLLSVAGLSLAAATAEPERQVIYIAPPAATLAANQAVTSAPIAEPQTIQVTARRTRLALASQRTARRSVRPVRERPRLMLAGYEPKLEPLMLKPLTLKPMRLPRLMPVRVAVQAPHPMHMDVATTYSHTFVIRTSSDPAIREKVRAAVAEAIGRAHDEEIKVRLKTIEKALGGPYIATIVSESDREGE